MTVLLYECKRMTLATAMTGWLHIHQDEFGFSVFSWEQPISNDKPHGDLPKLLDKTVLGFACLDRPVWPVSRTSRHLFGPGKLFYVCHFAFKIKPSKFWINEAELTGLWARNCVTIQQFFIFKFEICLRVRKVTGPSEKRVPEKALKRFYSLLY